MPRQHLSVVTTSLREFLERRPSSVLPKRAEGKYRIVISFEILVQVRVTNAGLGTICQRCDKSIVDIVLLQANAFALRLIKEEQLFKI